MNKEEVDKWLDKEYGCSYTKLEKLHDYYFEKYTDQKEKIERLKMDIRYWEDKWQYTKFSDKDYKSRIDKANWWLKEMLKQAKSEETKAIINGTLELLLNGGDEE